MNLETILRYVCLPKDPLLSAQNVDKPQDYVNYSRIFELLREKNVRTILRLRVEDNDALPHSDETIVSALKGIHVDVWDWEQYDICCDTIAEASPNVKEVFLYSTGNKAVLQSWTGEDGLKKLRHVLSPSCSPPERIDIAEISFAAQKGSNYY